jgi:WD40 repeat protein
LRVAALALSPDSQFLAISDVAAVEIWHPQTARRVQRLEPHLAPVFGIAFSPDGKRMVCLSETGCAIYATDGFEHVATLGELFSDFSAVVDLASSRASFSPGGNVLALPLYQQNRVRLWDAQRHEDLAFLDLPQNVLQATFTADGNFLFTSGVNEAWLFRANLTAERLSLSGHDRPVPGICFSPDGSRIASVGKDRTLQVRDAASGRVVWQAPLPDQGQAVCFSPDGRLLVTTPFSTRLLWVWDAETGTRLLESGSNEYDTTWSAQFSSDGRYLATACAPYSGIKVWLFDSLGSGTGKTHISAKAVRSYAGPIWSLAFAPNAPQLAFISHGPIPARGLYLWNLAGDAPPRLVTDDILSCPQNVSFTPDGRQIVLLDLQRCVVHRDTLTGSKVSSFATLDKEHPGDWVSAPNLCLSPNGNRVAVASPSRLGVDIWGNNGRFRYSLPEQNGTVYWLAWSPNSQRLAVSRSNGEISIWNLPEIERVLAQLRFNP